MTPAPRAALAALVVPVLAGAAILAWPSLSALQADLDTLRGLLIRAEAWRAARPVLSPAIFALAVAAGASLPVPVLVPLSLIGGAVFGFWLGMALVLAGSLAAATVTFWLGRTVLDAPVRRVMGARAAAFDARVAESGLPALLSLRLTPGLPFFALNLLSGLSRIRLRDYLLVTAPGLMPNTAILVAAGTQIAEIERVRDIVGPRIIAMVVLLAAFPWVARLVARRVRRQNGAR